MSPFINVVYEYSTVWKSEIQAGRILFAECFKNSAPLHVFTVVGLFKHFL